MKNHLEKCPINVDDKFTALASSHRSQKKCGKEAGIICQLPLTYQDGKQQFTRMENFKLCLEHACETAVNKRELPEQIWSAVELIFLIENGCQIWDLVESSCFSSSLALSEKDKHLKTDKVKSLINIQILKLKAHPNFTKVNSIFRDRLELLEVFAE